MVAHFPGVFVQLAFYNQHNKKIFGKKANFVFEYFNYHIEHIIIIILGLVFIKIVCDKNQINKKEASQRYVTVSKLRASQQN